MNNNDSAFNFEIYIRAKYYFRKMAPDSNLCQKNQYGYCKFKDKCRKKHIDEICKNFTCKSNECEKRHPRKCLYFKRYQMCKFGEFCRYMHDSFENNFEKKFMIELCEMNKRIDTLEKHSE